MEHVDKPHPWGPWADRVINSNQKLPWIAPGALLGVLVTSVLVGALGIHADHESTQAHLWHKVQHASHLSLWIFMSWLGTEIYLKRLRDAGLFVILTIFGGVAIPYTFVVVALRFGLGVDPVVAHAVSLGAMATDVAFSVGVSDMVRSHLAGLANKETKPGAEEVKSAQLLSIVVLYCLFPLAGGDDLWGVGMMAQEYATNFSWPAFSVVLLTTLVLFWLGEGGRTTQVVEHEATERPIQILDLEGNVVKEYKERTAAWTEMRHVGNKVEAPAFWHAAAVFMTVMLHIAGLEIIIGGCIVYLLAPNQVKENLMPKFEVIVPFVLVVFGFTACSINVFDAALWTDARTWVTFAASHMGKMVGVTGMGLLARHILRNRTFGPGEVNWTKMPTGQIFTLGNWASAIGTVGIIFLSTAVYKKIMPAEEAAPYKLGFLLTVVAVYAENAVAVRVRALRDFFYKESPDFQPPPELAQPVAEIGASADGVGAANSVLGSVGATG